MKLRLAFGVVAQLQPSILLLDEVLAVGDLRFQDKCIAHIRELREHGTSVLLASHSLDEVQEQCDVAVWLQGGAVRAAGDVTSVVEEYRERMQSETRNRTPPVDGNGAGTLELRRNRFGSQELTIERVALRGPEGSPATEVASGSPLSVAVELDNHSAPVEDPIVGVSIHRAADGVVAYDCNTESAGVRLGRVAGTASVTLLLEHLDLEPGEYMVDVGVYEPAWAYAYDFHWQAYPLRVLGLVSGSGLARPAQRWTVAE
jgi:lipopolysaccharide transport system ATP-binding protein